MSNRMPSLLALLGLAAVAGYQNRDKLKGLMDRARPEGLDPGTDTWQSEQDADPRRSTADFGATLQSGIRDLIGRFRQLGDDQTPQSWVGTGQNQSVTPSQLRGVLGDDVVAELAQKTGLTEVNLMSRLAQVLPGMVDELTPGGTVQAQDDRLPAAT